MVGIRSGDNYNWDYSGVITATQCLSLNNEFQDVWGYEWNSWSYRTNRMNIHDNFLTAANSRHPTNQVWNPQVDSARLSAFMPVPNSRVGVAIAGVQSGSLRDYPGGYDVRLSSFSGLPVSINYALTGKSQPASRQETVLAAGTLRFAPGETHKPLNLALPGIQAFGFLRLALSQPQNAEITGPDLLYIATGPAPADAVLIPRGAGGWSYQAMRTEPPGAWEAPDAAETNWVQGANAPIGFGTLGTTDPFVTLKTVLNPTEQGPASDRTRTVYFRRHFQLADPPRIRELQLNVLRDDGAVVYLNGTEIGRHNIDSVANPGGTVDYGTLATHTTDNADESTYFQMPVSAELLPGLRAGDNVIALEVHQASATSSDLVMDLELTATFHPPVAGAQGIGREASGAPFLYWFDERWELQRSTNLMDWTPVPAVQSPWTPAPESSSEFFRWKR